MKTNRNFITFQLIKRIRNLYKLKNPPYLDLDTHFPEYRILEENWEQIRDEIVEIIKNSASLPKFHEIDSAQDFISNNDGISWNLFVVKLYDLIHKSNADKCPKTFSILNSIKVVKTINFSILAPGKHIPAHRGPYRGILRYQLALEVPSDDDCYILVDDKPYHWKEGKSVLFDDTYFHEVHNNTKSRRIALLLDIKRHDFTLTMKLFDAFYFRIIQLSIIISGVMKKSKVN